MVTWGDERIWKKEFRRGRLSRATFLLQGAEREAGKQSHLRGNKSKVKKDGGRVLERRVEYERQTEVTLNKEAVDQLGKVENESVENMVSG